MSNLREVFLQGREGRNVGLTTGLPVLDEAINGIQRSTSIGLVAAPKVGKTTLADYCFVLMPYLDLLLRGMLDNIQFIYFSYEVDRIGKEFKFAAFFFAYDHQIYNFMYKGKLYGMSKEYLMGRLVHRYVDAEGNKHSEPIIVSDEHADILGTIYVNRIIPLFGLFDANGNKIQEGKIRFIAQAENPTGMYKYLQLYAKAFGHFIEESYAVMGDDGNTVFKTREVGYVPNNPDKFTIIITDHVRKLRRERGFSLKETIDKWLEYTTELRNLCGFTFINICHSNRGLANIDRLRVAGEFIFPTTDDTKDTGNLGEESTILITLFNPNDEKYGLKKHFGAVLSQFPFYRSIHITESRDTFSPVHIQTNMYGGINMFTPLK